MESAAIHIYTDGSCNTEYKVGGWAAVIIFNDEEIEISGVALNTTHNRMELISVINAIDYVEKNLLNWDEIVIYSDSQYVVRIADRKGKIIKNKFLTKKGDSIQNADLVGEIINYIESLNINLIKVKAHQKKDNNKNYNRVVDKISRKIVRQYVADHFSNI